MQNDQSKNGQPVSVGSTGGSASSCEHQFSYDDHADLWRCPCGATKDEHPDVGHIRAQRDHLRRALEEIEGSCDKPSATWETANSALLRLGEPAKIVTEAERLREVLEEIEREASGALNNAMPEDAPDILDHIHGIARRALSPNGRDEPRRA